MPSQCFDCLIFSISPDCLDCVSCLLTSAVKSGSASSATRMCVFNSARVAFLSTKVSGFCSCAGKPQRNAHGAGAGSSLPGLTSRYPGAWSPPSISLLEFGLSVSLEWNSGRIAALRLTFAAELLGHRKYLPAGITSSLKRVTGEEIRLETVSVADILYWVVVRLPTMKTPLARYGSSQGNESASCNHHLNVIVRSRTCCPLTSALDSL